MAKDPKKTLKKKDALNGSKQKVAEFNAAENLQLVWKKQRGKVPAAVLTNLWRNCRKSSLQRYQRKEENSFNNTTSLVLFCVRWKNNIIFNKCWKPDITHRDLNRCQKQRRRQRPCQMKKEKKESSTVTGIGIVMWTLYVISCLKLSKATNNPLN